jgi:hypothetical protein
MRDWPAGLARRLDRTGLQWQESNRRQFVSAPVQADSLIAAVALQTDSLAAVMPLPTDSLVAV